MTILPEGCPF
ncbi:hypothetical protein D046_8236A, partial [Vibrio parahaemolyticus V-223/04]